MPKGLVFVGLTGGKSDRQYQYLESNPPHVLIYTLQSFSDDSAKTSLPGSITPDSASDGKLFVAFVYLLQLLEIYG